MLNIALKKSLVTPGGRMDLDVKFSVAPGEFVSVFGESGAGKTTILRIISGLTQPQDGRIDFNGQVWLDNKRGVNLSVQRRPVSFVFQTPALFPHMTVQENIEFGLRNKNERGLAEHYLQLMGLNGLEDRRPHLLSGGQKQRAALARALVRRPEVLLLDEPFSSLDIEMRVKLQDDLLTIHNETKVTTILVSHDVSEVFKLSQKVFLLQNGGIVKSGKPAEVFSEQTISGKFKFSGQIVEIIKDGVINILTVQIGNNLSKVVATDDEIRGLHVGSKVIVAAKAFNPIILKQDI